MSHPNQCPALPDLESADIGPTEYQTAFEQAGLMVFFPEHVDFSGPDEVWMRGVTQVGVYWEREDDGTGEELPWPIVAFRYYNPNSGKPPAADMRVVIVRDLGFGENTRP